MEKVISIDGKEMRFVSNGATPRVYRILFGSDVFRDIDKITGKGEGGYTEGSMEVIENLIYCFGRQGGSIPKDMSIDEWLETIEDPMALAVKAEEVMDLWSANGKTTSSPKTKGGKRTAHSRQASTS